MIIVRKGVGSTLDSCEREARRFRFSRYFRQIRILVRIDQYAFPEYPREALYTYN